ncbi:MAG TPA: leucyl aminopeptidase [Rhodothermales bacterium]
MKIVVSNRPAGEVNTDLLFVPLNSGGASEKLESLRRKLRLRGDAVRQDFEGKRDQIVLFYRDGKGPRRIALVGCGDAADLEETRRGASNAAIRANELEVSETAWLIDGDEVSGAQVEAVVEGFILGAYRFDRYRTKDTPVRALKQLTLVVPNGDVKAVRASAKTALEISEATCFARDLVNLSPHDKSAADLARMAAESAARHGVSSTVWGLDEIREAGMGGLLAVNRGSEGPPSFTILEWKPEGAVNRRPIVLVGKGVIFDTGGLSLKPTLNSMDKMKNDMAGAAAVIAAVEATARLNLPVHVIALVPATDNRPGKEAYVPGEVVYMHSGATVEVLNTDAEGRMILADALSYARSLDPEIVIDIATLTGAQVVALGTIAAAILANKTGNAQAYMTDLIGSGERTGDLVAPLPLFDAYAEAIKSDVADIKNVGNRHAGAITAAKFLEHFVDYPWIHLDIAGPAFMESRTSYRVKGGTGFGVRLFVDFLRQFAEKASQR